MSFEPENDLERALMRAPREESARPEFYRLLLESEIFVIGDVVDSGIAPGEAGNVQQGSKLRLAGIQHEGHTYNLIFTSLARLETFTGKPEQYLKVQGRELFMNTRGAHFALNPGSEYGKELVPEEIEYLLAAPSAGRNVTFDKETKVLLGRPSVYPHELMDALKAAFAVRADVQAAYLLYIAYEGSTDPPHPIIGVEIANVADWPAVSEAIGVALKAAGPDMIVDVLPLERNDPSEVAQALLKITPFYSRETKA